MATKPKPTELEEALKKFRLDILNAFANLEIEIHALQTAVLHLDPVTQQKLDKFRQEERRNLEKFRGKYAETIGLPHELR